MISGVKPKTMKKLICLILFSVFFCLENVAQQPQNMEPLSNKTTRKGRRELRRENRIHHAMEGLASKNERRARREHDLGTANHHDSKAKKLSKDRKKAKLKEEKDQLKAQKEKSKNENGDAESVADSKGG
jgi:hypothetical protein